MHAQPFAINRRLSLLCLALLLTGAALAGSPPATTAPEAARGRVVQEIHFQGNHLTRDNTIRRELFLQPGERLDPEKLERDLHFKPTRLSRVMEGWPYEGLKGNGGDSEGDDGGET